MLLFLLLGVQRLQRPCNKFTKHFSKQSRTMATDTECPRHPVSSHKVTNKKEALNGDLKVVD
jgi:hypothetical protein